MTEQTAADGWYSRLEIRQAETPDSEPEIYLDGQKVNGVISFRLEADAYEKRVPELTIKVRCKLTLDCKAIPLLPEPWTWFYAPKTEGFTEID